MTVTRWWWLRHAPVRGHAGRLYGDQDVPCDCGDAAVFRALARQIPAPAVWLVTPLSRTRATAEAITRHLAYPPETFEVEPRFSEQHFGTWQGLTYAELESRCGAAWKSFWQAPAENTPPGGESFATLSARVADGIEDLTQRHAGRDIVCIAHGGPIRAALAHALGATPAQALAFTVDNCTLTRLDHIAAQNPDSREQKGGGWRIALVNARAHVPGEIAETPVDTTGGTQ
ncbi:MAG: histidine phosphatase family protein [Kiloniellaceae bacterium]